MLIRDSLPSLQERLQGSGQALNRLEPWEAWKVFKTFLHAEIEDGYDAACLQFAPGEAGEEPDDESAILLVRQFSARDADSGEDELLGRVVLELRYAARHFQGLPAAEVWTLDFPALEEWASVVEGLPCFQEAMARQPLFTEVYYDEG